jgi:hypothetical protein
MVVNFKTRRINRDARKLTRNITLNLKNIYIYIYIPSQSIQVIK